MEIIEQIGSYAGLAAIVGLAVLSALYFSQARDVKRLREWAGRAPERAAPPVAQRVVAQPQPQPAPGQPVAQPAPGAKQGPPVVPEPPQAPPQVPGAPAPAIAASAGARPATATAAADTGATAATAERPTGPGAATPAGQGKQGPGDEKPGQPDANGEQPREDGPQAATATADTVTPSETTAPPDKAGEGDVDAKPPPPPVTPASAEPTTQAVPPTIPAPPARAATPAGQARPVPPSPPRFARPTPPARPAPQPTAIIPPGYGATPAGGRTDGLGRGRIAAVAVAGVLVIGGGAAFAVSQLTGDDEPAKSGDSGQGAAGANNDGDRNAGDGRPAVNPADVTVAILNGTLVPGLAANIGDEAARLGFDVGVIGDASDQEQQRAESVVLYASGHRREAVVVSRRLKINQREQIDPDTQALAGDAGVVVIAGADKTP